MGSHNTLPSHILTQHFPFPCSHLILPPCSMRLLLLKPDSLKSRLSSSPPPNPGAPPLLRCCGGFGASAALSAPDPPPLVDLAVFPC